MQLRILMMRVFSWIQNVLLRQIMIVFLVGLTSLGMQAFSSGNAMLAQADTVKTPEGIYYKGVPDGNTPIRSDRQINNAQRNIRESAENAKENLKGNQPFSRSGETVKTPEGTYYKGTPNRDNINNNNIFDKAKESLEETAENIKEKLNLNEPVPESTK